MKAIFISYNQAIGEQVMAVLDRNYVRGFTRWTLTQGRGSFDGEPHYASHAWPSMNSSILTIVDDQKVESLLAALRELDAEAPQQGIRAFVWEITGGL